MKIKLPDRKRVLRGIVIFVLVAISLLYFALPTAFGIAAVFPTHDQVAEPPPGFEETTLTTPDGIDLKAWYIPPTNGAVVVLVHGAGGTRESVRSYTPMLTRHGYGVLAIDLRGHGESEGATNRFGWQGTPDVGAAIFFLQQREEVRAIGGLGLSMGGEALLGAASQYPVLRAIVADGATQRCTRELLALESERPLVRNFTARVMYAVVQLITGDNPPKPLLDSMVDSQSTAFFLIAGGNNAIEVDFNKMYAATLGNRAHLWIAPETDHTAAFSRYGDDYEQRIIAFFDTELLK